MSSEDTSLSATLLRSSTGTNTFMAARRGGGSAFPRDGQNMNPRKGGQDGGHDRGGRFSQRRGGRGGTRGYYHQDGTDSRSVEQGSTLLPQPQNDQKGSWESLLKTLLAMDGQQYGMYISLCID